MIQHRNVTNSTKNKAAATLLIVFAAAMASTASDAAAAPISAAETRLLRQRLRELHCPEILELVHDPRSLDSREMLAAAYALEGAATTDPVERRSLLDRAEAEYAAILTTAEADHTGDQSHVLRMQLARIRLAWGSTILRYQLVRDLDRFEILGGLAPPPKELGARLDECLRLFRRARSELDTLHNRMRENEQEFLLLGIADELRSLLAEATLNLAWSATWSAALTPTAMTSLDLLDDALRQFDDARILATEDASRDSAAIGRIVAMRHLARYDEALVLLDAMIESKPRYDVDVRAHYERGKLLLAMKRYEDARSVLARLSGVTPDQVPAEYASARFYIALSPLLIGDSYLLEAQAANNAALRDRGVEQLAALTARGGPWPELVETYFRARNIERDPTRRTPAELSAAAQAAMQRKDYDAALKLWRGIIEKTEPGTRQAEAWYNAAACMFQLGKTAEAGAAFTSAVRAGDDTDMKRRAAYFAFRCLAQAAGESRTPSAYVALADACKLLLSVDPTHAEADEVTWIRAVSLQEAEHIADARSAFAEFPSRHPRYWEARRSVVACSQMLLDADHTATGEQLSSRLDKLAAEWFRLGLDMRAAASQGDDRITLNSATDAELSGIEILASESARRFRDALTALSRMNLDTADNEKRGRVLALQIRCHRGLGQFDQAAAVLDEFIRTVPDERTGDVLIGLAVGMEAEIDRLTRLQRVAEARQVAEQAEPTLRELLRWMERQPDRAADVAIVRFSLVKVLDRAEKHAEALRELTTLRKAEPRNGAYLLHAARITESAARRLSGSEQRTQLKAAEDLWAELLSDTSLRTVSPETYWEARYYWLRLRFEAGYAAEVARGIEAEQAWDPALGGSPWQGRLLSLADQAKRSAARASTP